MVTEEWRDIPGYEGYYQASNMGGHGKQYQANQTECIHGPSVGLCPRRV